MRRFRQTNGCKHPPAGRKWKFPLGGGFRWAGLALATWLGWTGTGFAQTLKLGLFDLSLIGRAEVGYDSNVDDVYPEERESGLKEGDFYWMPGLSLNSQPVAMSHRTTMTLAADIAYEDYFIRNDLDTEIYSAAVDIQSVHPRLTLGGMAGVDYSIEGIADQYVPGGASRDPVLTTEASVFANWNYRKFRIETHADWTRELHDFEKFQAGDQDERALFAGAYLDLFTWGSLYYTVEDTTTLFLQSEEEENKTDREFGLTGAVPFELLEHPKITYSFGFESIDETGTGNDISWEPTHTITVSDELQLSKTVILSASAMWENKVEEDTVDFQYNVTLSQQLGPRAEHSVSFTQEPRPTFGSTSDTETTSYRYDFGVNDLFIYNLFAGFGALYEEDTPLGEEGAVTEKTTTLSFRLNHTRQLTKKLARIIAYEYTWENSNFHVEGANEKHLLTYGFTYAF